MQKAGAFMKGNRDFMKRLMLAGLLPLFLTAAAVAQSTTSNLGITKPQTGQAQPQVTIATGFDQFDAAIAGRQTKSVTTADVTLTTTEARNKILEFSGALTGNRAVIVPTATRTYLVYNGCTGAFTLTVKTSGGTGVVVNQGDRVWLYCDGTNVVAAAGGGGGGGAWSAITSPSGNLALTMAANTSTFTFNNSTGSANLFQLTDSTTNSSASGSLFQLTTTTGSTLKPFRVDVKGSQFFTINNGSVDQTAGQVLIGAATADDTDSKVEIIGASSSSDDQLLRIISSNGTSGVTFKNSSSRWLTQANTTDFWIRRSDAATNSIKLSTSATSSMILDSGVNTGTQLKFTASGGTGDHDWSLTETASAHALGGGLFVIRDEDNSRNAKYWSTTATATTETSEVNNGAKMAIGQLSESITLNTVGTTTDSTIDLPAGSIILSVTARVTTTITTATDWKLGDPTVADRFSDANATMTSGTTTVGINQWKADRTTAGQGPFQAGTAKVRITTTGTPGAGVIRIVITYISLTAPTS
jgi:hypothetical protein